MARRPITSTLLGGGGVHGARSATSAIGSGQRLGEDLFLNQYQFDQFNAGSPGAARRMPVAMNQVMRRYGMRKKRLRDLDPAKARGPVLGSLGAAEIGASEDTSPP